MAETRPALDPIAEARRQWIDRGWTDAADGMAVVTSIMRVQQLMLADIDEVLKPFEVTFARFEILTLLSFSSTGAMPIGKVGARLQVHPTSVTPAVERLERQGLVRRARTPPTAGRRWWRSPRPVVSCPSEQRPSSTTACSSGSGSPTTRASCSSCWAAIAPRRNRSRQPFANSRTS